MFHDKYQWEIWKNTAGKSASYVGDDVEDVDDDGNQKDREIFESLIEFDSDIAWDPGWFDQFKKPLTLKTGFECYVWQKVPHPMKMFQITFCIWLFQVQVVGSTSAGDITSVFSCVRNFSLLLYIPSST